MSKPVSSDYAIGSWHIVIRLKGSQMNIDRFHDLMLKCEGDWPWRSSRRTTVQMCDRCMGCVCQSPRVTPEDIKAAAKQCGVKVKIDKFGPEDSCFLSDKRWTSTTFLEREEAMKLTRFKTKSLVVLDRKVMTLSEAEKATAAREAGLHRIAEGIQPPERVLVN